MARIVSFSPVVKEHVRRHSEVDCGFATVTYQGARALLLETYGSSDRKSDPKISQSLLLDEASATQLLNLLRATFPRLG